MLSYFRIYSLQLCFILWAMSSLVAQTRGGLGEQLRQGKLPNGLSYYVLQDKGMPGKVSYYIYQNVGAVLEQDNQQGVAHLLEHLAFNTTQHFPQGVMSYLRSRGLHDFEAYTGKDETYYAVHGVSVQDKDLNTRMLELLHDWSHGLKFTAQDIRKEQGIVVEEWRQRNDVHRRLSEAIAPVIYNHSIYAKRNVIGNQEIIKGIKLSEVETFYKAWYRPNMQFIAIIGDIEPAQVETQLIAMLGKIKAQPHAHDGAIRSIPDNDKPLFSRFIDTENKSASLGIYQRFPIVDPRNKAAVLQNIICTRFFNRLAPRRFAMLRNDNREHYIAATVSLSDLTRGYRQFAWDIVPYQGAETKALLQVLAIREQLLRNGFTSQEFEEAKRAMYQDIKSLLDSKALGTPDNYFDAFKLNFLYGEPILTFRTQLNETLEALVELEVEDLNKWLNTLGGDKNLSFVTYSRTPGEMRLSEEDFTKALREAKNTIIEPSRYASIDSLIDYPIKPGRIVNTRLIPELEAEEWTLSNGAKVYYKYFPSAKRNYFAGSALGGRSVVSPQDLPAYLAMRSLVMQSGVYRYSRNQLHQWLAKKDFELSLSAEDLSDGVGGNMTKEEAKDFFAYLHLVLSKHNFNSEQFAKYIQRNILSVKTRNLQGMDAVQDSIQQLLYPYSQYNPEKNESFYQKIKLDDVQRLFKTHLGNSARFTYCLVGDIPINEAKELVCRYIASLPSYPELSVATANPEVLNFSRPDSLIQKTFELDLNGDVGEVELSYVNQVLLDEEEQAAWEVFKGVLEQRLFSELREQQQATYSVGVRADYNTDLQPIATLSVHFTTDRERADSMKAHAERIIKALSEGNMTEDEFKAIWMPLYTQSTDPLKEMPKELVYLGLLNQYSNLGEVPKNPLEFVYTSPYSSLNMNKVIQTAKKVLGKAKERLIIVKSLPPHLRSWER